MSQPRFQRGSSQRHQQISGDNSGGETPDPIPNSEVKPSRADGTAGETLWESRMLPEFFWAHQFVGGPFFLPKTRGPPRDSTRRHRDTEIWLRASVPPC